MDLVWHRLNNAFIPVVTLEKASQISCVGDRAMALGLQTLEITLRTPIGLTAIEQLSAQCPQLILGAGTVLSARQARDAMSAGARYWVSPGWSDDIYTNLGKASDLTQVWMPGIATPSDVMRASAFGFSYLKFYPANLFGGLAALKGFAQLFPNVYFCPTGGVSLEQIPDYLALDNTFAVGGSWMNDYELFAQYLGR